MASPKSTAPILHYNNSNHQKQSRSCSTAKIILITMASLIVISLVSLLILFSVSSASRHSKNNPAHPPPQSTPPYPPSFPAAVAQVSVACKATRYPDTCQNSLSKRVPENPTPTQVLEAAISVSAENLVTAKKMVVSIRDSSSGNKNRTTAAKICLQVLDYSEYRTQSAADALPHGKIKDARAWFSAALAYQYDCWSGLKYVNGTKLVGDTMTFLNSLMGLTSNALSMMSSYENYGSDFDTWKPPKTERDGFWEKVGSGGGGGFSGFNGGLPANLKEDVTVCKDGNCSYKTVQDAVNAAPNNVSSSKFVIGIKEGVYEETVRVPFEKKNVVFLGDGIGKTVITGSLNVGQLGMTTYESATVGVLGDGFMASGLTFKNTAGPDAHQAVAFRSDSDLSVIEDCEFLGNQDTLYAKSLRQFYKKCRIQGNVDFIFGNSATIFQDCDILIAPRQLKPEHGEQNAVTAHGRTDPSQATGYVFHNCVINGTEEYMKYYNENPKVHRNYLGRPWKEYSRTVFVNSILEILVSPEGWLPWSGDQALKTLYYGEFGNSGPGSDTSKRVSWSSQIPADHVDVYSVENFIQGDEWISSSS